MSATIETKTYNGWTNYETWSLSLLLDNDEGSYRYWRDVAQECWDTAEASDARESSPALVATLVGRPIWRYGTIIGHVGPDSWPQVRVAGGGEVLTVSPVTLADAGMVA